MVSVTGEGHAIFKILDLHVCDGQEPQNKTLELAENVFVAKIIRDVGLLCDRADGTFGLILQWGRNKANLTNMHPFVTIADVGVDFTSGTMYTLLVTERLSSPAEIDQPIEHNKDTTKLNETGVNISMSTQVAMHCDGLSTDFGNDEKPAGGGGDDDDNCHYVDHVNDEDIGRVAVPRAWEHCYDKEEDVFGKTPRKADWMATKSGPQEERIAAQESEESESNRRGENGRVNSCKSNRTSAVNLGRRRERIAAQESEESEPNRRGENAYVGLVNQAMTCYLNSLIQALYMTPEFRNALYNWEYVNDPTKDENKNIPYQLQKLFLNLQTSSKNAIETTSLTKSFGWDSTQAWQQHDIQELCRVMFDALEQTFKNTEQANLINDLYEGQMTDYVKCLECGTEKSRQDTFLDIPLPVRPFGSNVAYNSVQEALGAFVQPETLDGTNQYHCETCDKKCDAHKGLKFTKFPYFLTLHLKRFDFDYNTFHRIKLNDEVTFPDLLNLNSFVPSTTDQDSSSCIDESKAIVKCEEITTTTTKTVDDECPPCNNGISVDDPATNDNHNETKVNEDIERINGATTSSFNSHNHNEKNSETRPGPRGPYEYELFSIMIHSGSASGGHYYAYIKDFKTGDWLCFNDQNVSAITYDDIQKTYGGGPTRAYYSGVYSSSSNAYMLMYRQIDPARNALPMQVADFPKHLQELLIKIQDKEDNELKTREMLMQMYKLKVFCHHPFAKRIVSAKLFGLYDETWAELTQRAYKVLLLDNLVDRDQVRLVTYQASNGFIGCSYDDRAHEPLGSIFVDQSDVLMEIRKKDETFKTYFSGGIAKKIFVIDVTTKKVTKGPINVRGLLSQTVQEYKELLGVEIGMEPKDINLIIQYPSNLYPRLVTENESSLKDEGFASASKIFVPICSGSKKISDCIDEILDIVCVLISLNVQLPDLSKEALRFLNIPTIEEKRKADAAALVTNGPPKLSSVVVEAVRDAEKMENNETTATTTKSNVSDELTTLLTKTTSPPTTIPTEAEDWHTPEQSNSEDSSLSYSDRTLVGEDDASDYDDYPLANVDQELFNQTNQENGQVGDEKEYFFNVTRDEHEPDKLLRVLVNKRMVLGTLKKLLEPHIGVPMEYFRVFCQPGGEHECVRLSMVTSFHEDGDTLYIKLGLALRNDEFKVRLYELYLDSETEPFRFIREWVVSKDATVGQTKKEILAELKTKFSIDIPYERCRLRRKHCKTASNAFLDDEKIKDLRFDWPREIIVQELPAKETVTDQNDVILFARGLSNGPSKVAGRLNLGPIQELVVNGKSLAQVREKLSEISGIPEEHIEMAKGKSSLPDNLLQLLVQKFIDWNRPSSTSDDTQPICLENGTFIYYRDIRKNVREECGVKDKVLEHALEDLLAQDMKSKLTSRGYPTYGESSTSTSRPRRERALKICVDDKWSDPQARSRTDAT